MYTTEQMIAQNSMTQFASFKVVFLCKILSTKHGERD